MPKKVIRIIFIVIGIWLVLVSFLITRQHIDELDNPKTVSQIYPHGILLQDGTLVELPYITEMPVKSPVFQAALKHGIEINQDGNVYGILKLWHYCGNDPIRLDLRKVNLSDLAAFLHPKGATEKYSVELYIQDDNALKYFNHYSSHGWNYGTYLWFKRIIDNANKYGVHS
jgi:hypothetical protein